MQDPRDSLEMAWYAPPDLASRLYYVSKRKSAGGYWDSLDSGMMILPA